MVDTLLFRSKYLCGIAGFYDEKVKNFQKIKKFTNQLIHRGPDEEDFFRIIRVCHLECVGYQ